MAEGVLFRGTRKFAPYAEVFDGSTSIISLPEIAALRGATAFSSLAYVRCDGAGEGSLGYVYGFSNGATITGPRMNVAQTPGANRLLFAGYTSIGGGAPSVTDSTGDATTFGWVHVGSTWDGSFTGSQGQAKLLLGIGGGPIRWTSTGTGDGNGTPIIMQSGSLVHIGNRGDNTRTWNGRIGYVAMWNRKLSTNELQCAQFNGPLSVPQGLVLCWSGGVDHGPFGYTPVLKTAVTQGPAGPGAILLGTSQPIFYSLPTGGGSPYTLTAASGAFSLTGNATGLRAARQLPTSVGAFTLTGNAAGLAAQRQLAAGVGSFTLTGNDATLTYTPTGAYVMPAATGTFTLTGNAAGLAAARQLPTATGTFTLTGNATAFTHGYRLTAEKGTFSLTGNDATLTTTGTVVTNRGGGASKAKIKRKHSQKSMEVDPTITEVIENLEADRQFKDGVIEHTKKVVKKVDTSTQDVERLSEVKEVLKALLPPIVEAKQEVKEKVEAKPIDHTGDFTALNERLDKIDVMLAKIMKRCDHLADMVMMND